MEKYEGLKPLGISRFSAGKWSCQKHDEMFPGLDTNRIDLSDPENLFKAVYRMVLRQTHLSMARWEAHLHGTETQEGQERFKETAFVQPVSDASREGSMYVDYVRDLTASNGEYYLNSRTDSEFGFGPYVQPESVQLCRTICDAGLDSEQGLGILASIWRGFEPKPDTRREELKGLIAETLLQLQTIGLCEIDEA